MAAVAVKSGLRDVSRHHDRAGDLVRQIIQGSDESADLTAFDFIAAVQVDGDVEHDEACVIVLGRFTHLVVKRREHRLSSPVKDDKFVVFAPTREQRHRRGLVVVDPRRY